MAPQVIVFDVNETLSDLGPMADRFTEVGASASAAQVWFARLLRDGFALTASGGRPVFAELAAGVLPGLLAGVPLNRPIEDAVAHVMGGFAELRVHPDVPDGVRALHDRGLRLVTLTNGSTQVADRLLTAAGVRDRFERLMSVDGSGTWKPARSAYDYAVRELGVAAGELLLVAVHPWDIDGAARAGLRTAWINRGDGSYPPYFTEPDYTVAALPELAPRLELA